MFIGLNIFYFTIKIQETLMLILSRGMHHSWVRVSDKLNQDILRIEANCAVFRDDMGQWIKKVMHK